MRDRHPRFYSGAILMRKWQYKILHMNDSVDSRKIVQIFHDISKTPHDVNRQRFQCMKSRFGSNYFNIKKFFTI